MRSSKIYYLPQYGVLQQAATVNQEETNVVVIFKDVARRLLGRPDIRHVMKTGLVINCHNYLTEFYLHNTVADGN